MIRLVSGLTINRISVEPKPVALVDATIAPTLLLLLQIRGYRGEPPERSFQRFNDSMVQAHARERQ